jgi:hypothetical protein
MNNWQIVIYFCVSTVSPEHCNETTAYEVARPLETYPQAAWCRFIAARLLPTYHPSDINKAVYPVANCVQTRALMK